MLTRRRSRDSGAELNVPKPIKSILMKRPTENDYGHDLESLILDTLTCGFIEFSKTSLIREVAISNHFMTCLRHASAIGFGISKHESFKVFKRFFVRPIESIDVIANQIAVHDLKTILS